MMDIYLSMPDAFPPGPREDPSTAEPGDSGATEAFPGAGVDDGADIGRFLDRFDGACPGDFVAYHVGDLAIDRGAGDRGRAVRACQAVAMGLFGDREAHLVQRRLGPHRYVYYAVKR